MMANRARGVSGFARVRLLFALVMSVCLAWWRDAWTPVARPSPHDTRRRRGAVLLRRIRGGMLAALLLGASGTMQTLAAAQHGASREQLLALMFWATTKRFNPATGSDEHFGTATKPQAFTSYTPSNAYGVGATHSPTTPAQLNTVLTGGALAAGDTIVIQKNTCYNDATYSSHRFPVVAGTDVNPIRVITSDLATIPAPGNRRNRTTHRNSVTNFRTINTNCPFNVHTGASGYQFVGIDIDAGSVTGFDVYDIARIGPVASGAWSSLATYSVGDATYNGWISLQNGNINHAQVVGPWWRQMELADLPSGIVFDRCDIWIRNHSNRGRRTMGCEAQNFVLTGCTIGNEGYTGFEEAKAVNAVSAAGPWLVDNNEILAPGISILWGGAVPGFDTMVEDCVVTRNALGQLTRWLPNHDDWDGLSRKHKNCGEIKTGRRFDVHRNVIQNGYDGVLSQYQSFVIKCSNGTDTGGQPGYLEAETCDITVRQNRFLNVNGLIDIGAQDNYNGGPLPDPVHDVSIYHNYTDGLFGAQNAGGGKNAKAIKLKGTAVRVHIEHLTAFGDYTKADCQLLFISDGGLPVGLVFRNIIGSWGNQYGAIWANAFTYTGINIFGGSGSSASALYLYDPTNLRPGGVGSSTYNTYTWSTSAAGMVTDFAGGDWTTAAALAGAGYGGRTPGCDVTYVAAQTANAVAGVWV